MSTNTGFFGLLGLAAHRGRRGILALTGLFVLASLLWGLGVFNDVSQSGFEDPASESARAMDLLQDELGHADIDVIAVFRSDETRVDNPSFAKAVQRIADDLPEDVVSDFDLYLEWAKAIVHGGTDVRPSRRFAGGMIALRPDQDGRISHYEGVEEVQRRHGEWILDQHFPSPGTPTQGIDAGYMANAWMRLRHPDYDGLRGVMDDIGRTLKVHAR